MRDVLYLVKNGVPFEVAAHLPPTKRLAWVVMMGEMDGKRWDWDAMRWLAG